MLSKLLERGARTFAHEIPEILLEQLDWIMSRKHHFPKKREHLSVQLYHNNVLEVFIREVQEHTGEFKKVI